MPRQRKAGTNSNDKQKPKLSPHTIPLAYPDRSFSSTTSTDDTLLQLAAERNLFAKAERRRRELAAGRGSRRTDESFGDGDVESEADDYGSTDDGSDSYDEKTAKGMKGRGAGRRSQQHVSWRERVADGVLWTTSLASLHVTLDVLVQHQYAMEISWQSIALRGLRAFLVFLLVFVPLHAPSEDPAAPVVPPFLLPARSRSRHTVAPIVRQAIFLVVSVAAGCYMVHVTNRHGYLAVMKQAPPVGCLWVWSVIELRLGLACLSLACVGVFLRAGNYSVR